MAWLVSVRNEVEFSLAASYGVDIVDFKEPRKGALAPVDPQIWQQAARLQSSTSAATDSAAFELSAALGERSDMLQIASSVPPSFAFAKVGPSQCDSPQDLLQLWDDAAQRLPASVELVAVAYADYGNAACLPPEEVFELASQRGMKRCLLDTFTKTGVATLDALGIERLRRLATLARSRGIWWTLAGSIKLSHLEQLLANRIDPHCIGIRGDACDQNRTSSLSSERLKLWSDTMGKRKAIAADDAAS
ncbi:hypothetical protein K239x_15180 [Planctomycetes bacterium K23_9]|uniref:(5-formylfuran-3-yl)methyl phosphate synthase n=2 Tax=Stieleria marina TaxID=1930275 RepID=A0A517NR24_9BACT|nr:hypothetical protein K239x_15180 [Planctomycetes bacterium K23_9]